MTSRPPRIEVWVCARPDAPQLGAVLEALAAAGARPHIATAPRGQGPTAARNQALARCEAEVIALLDDDVEVCRGWLTALQAVWSAPGADRLGCAGAPLGARFVGVRQAWLGDELLAGLGVELDVPDAGAPTLVDVADRTFSAGNISFRADALRGIGGFWPARGAPGLRDRFCEEHRAQHELASAGWSAALVPDARALRRIRAADVRVLNLLAQRARTGARAAAVGAAAPAPTALRTAVKAAAGIPVAAVRADRAKVAERAARATQSVAQLASPILADRSLQPAVTRTPFLHSVAPAPPGPLRSIPRRCARTAGRLRGGTPIVLLYHRVSPERADPLALRVSPQNFAEQLEVLSTRRTLVGLEEIVAGEAPPTAAAITVDDGYVDAFSELLPALEAAGAPATIFVSTGHVRSGKTFWWDAVTRLLRDAPSDAGPLSLSIGGDTRAWPARDVRQREFVTHCLTSWLRALAPEAIATAIEAIGRWAGVDDPWSPAPEDRPMTVDELRRVAASPQITIGAHGVEHASMATLSPQRRDAELIDSRGDLHAWLGTAPAGIAYPYGVPGVDVDAATRAAAREAGYRYGVVNRAGRLSPRADPMTLPRSAVANTGADAFDAWLQAA